MHRFTAVRRAAIVAAALGLLAIQGCGGPDAGELVKESTSNYMTKNFSLSKTSEGKRIAVDGYLDFNSSGTFRFKSGETRVIGLYTKPDAKGYSLVSFSAKLDSFQNNTLDLPTSGSMSKARFVDNKGDKHLFTTKVRVSGTIKYVNMRPVELRDAETKRTETHYSYELENIRFDLAPH
jgi:hypothetical protein